MTPERLAAPTAPLIVEPSGFIGASVRPLLLPSAGARVESTAVGDAVGVDVGENDPSVGEGVSKNPRAPDPVEEEEGGTPSLMIPPSPAPDEDVVEGVRVSPLLTPLGEGVNELSE